MGVYMVTDEYDTIHKLGVVGTDREFSFHAENLYQLLTPKYRDSKARCTNNDLLIIPELRTILAARTVMDVMSMYKDVVIDATLDSEYMTCKPRDTKAVFRFKRIAESMFRTEQFENRNKSVVKGRVFYSHFIGFENTGLIDTFEPVRGVSFVSHKEIVKPEPVQVIEVAEPVTAVKKSKSIKAKAKRPYTRRKRQGFIVDPLQAYGSYFFKKYNDPMFLKAI